MSIVTELQELGIEQGDVLLVHSALSGMDCSPEELLDALIEVLDDHGTLIVPTFNFDWTNNAPNGEWNIEETPSQMGYFTELVRNKERSTRTVHPFYSFAILGDRAEEFGKIHSRDTFSRDYLFGTLHKENAKMMMVGLDYNSSWTYSHYIEQQYGVDYRYKKPFKGKMVVNGKEYYDRYTHFVRDLSRGIKTHVNPMGRKLENEGVVTTHHISNKEFKLGSAQSMYNHATELMKGDERLMYKVEK